MSMAGGYIANPSMPPPRGSEAAAAAASNVWEWPASIVIHVRGAAEDWSIELIERDALSGGQALVCLEDVVRLKSSGKKKLGRSQTRSAH